jgi:hypothetical protein
MSQMLDPVTQNHVRQAAESLFGLGSHSDVVARMGRSTVGAGRAARTFSPPCNPNLRPTNKPTATAPTPSSSPRPPRSIG